jgi:predicted ATPase
MLETVRAFALEELARAGEDIAIRGAHARWAEVFARDADEHVLGPKSGSGSVATSENMTTSVRL